MALEDPSFAGLFEEDGEMVVLGTDAERLSALEGRVAERAADAEVQLGRSASGIATKSRVTRYSFLELNAWRDLLFARIWGGDDVFSIDLDERANLLGIGVEAAGMEELQKLMRSLDIPADAWRLDVGSPDRPNNLITARQRPTQAGTNLKYHLSPNDYGCTLGFNAKRNGVMVFVTASHCSPGAYNLTSSLDQAQGPVVGAVIGNEFVDPTGWNCSSWIPFTQTSSNCRNADAAAYDYSIHDDSVGFGLVARHNDRHQGALPFGAPDRSYDETDPWEIVGVASSYQISQGKLVEKLGRTTGWTYGTVSQTCSRKKVNVLHGSGNYTVLCAYSAGYHSEGGDSGGPIIIIQPGGDEVLLAGIHYGNSGSTGRFSSMASIQQDLGTLVVYDPPPIPLGAVIGGPTEVPEDAYCTWQGFGTGGTAPYSFSWSGVLSGSGANKSGTVSNSGWLNLLVTDANQATATAQWYVTVDEDADECLEEQ